MMTKRRSVWILYEVDESEAPGPGFERVIAVYASRATAIRAAQARQKRAATRKGDRDTRYYVWRAVVRG